MEQIALFVIFVYKNHICLAFFASMLIFVIENYFSISAAIWRGTINSLKIIIAHNHSKNKTIHFYLLLVSYNSLAITFQYFCTL